MASLIDPTARGKYPVILGDGMLGKTSNDIFTGVRYNHKPTLSSTDGPAHARLKPSLPGKTSSYDLSFTDGGGSYAYAGTRSVDGNQYVLHFDPDRKAFVLDRIDSTFDMNLTRVPGNSDPAKLSRQFPHLDLNPRKSDGNTASKSSDAKPATPATTSAPAPKAAAPAKAAAAAAAAAAKSPAAQPQQPKPAKRKTDKKQVKQQQQKDIALSLPKPEPPKEKKSVGGAKKAEQRPKDEDEDEDEDDDDGGLLVEYPGGDNPAAAKLTDFSPAFPRPRRFDDFMDQRDSEGDADGESDGEPDFDFKLPSPVNNPAAAAAAAPATATAAHGDDDDAASADLEDDLEKDLENAFEDMANSQEGSPDGGDESEISEED
ncbi:hypothetical protein CDD83_1391 [Cordyceps sp. RAO-2017]|nr:hypothetical protein CDD83_1391 [Cordyceps sp. RAO-2017]